MQWSPPLPLNKFNSLLQSSSSYCSSILFPKNSVPFGTQNGLSISISTGNWLGKWLSAEVIHSFTRCYSMMIDASICKSVFNLSPGSSPWLEIICRRERRKRQRERKSLNRLIDCNVWFIYRLRGGNFIAVQINKSSLFFDCKSIIYNL